MATSTITQLTAVLATNLTMAAVLPVDDVNTQTRKATLAQVKSAYEQEAWSFGSNVAVAGTLAVTGATTLSGTLTRSGSAAATAVQYQDATPVTRFSQLVNGNTSWHDAAGTADVTLSRSGAATLGLTGALTISSTLSVTGAATFGSTVTLTDTLLENGGLSRKSTAGSITLAGGTSGDGGRIFLTGSTNANASQIRFSRSATEDGRMVDGILAWGTTVTTGAAAGDVVMGFNKALRGANSGGTGTARALVTGDTVGYLYPDADRIVAIGTTVTTGAGAGELVIGQAKEIRSVDAAGTGTVSLIYAAGGNIHVGLNTSTLHLGYGAAGVTLGQTGTGPVQVGSPATTSGASAEELLLGHGKRLVGVNADGTGTKEMIRIGPEDMVYLTGNDVGDLVRLPNQSFGFFKAPAAALSGGIGIDITNNRLIYYSNGNRYALTGVLV